MMRISDFILPAGAAFALAFATGPAAASPLRVVNVTSPDVLCVFNATCLVTATDTTGRYPPKAGYSGQPYLYTRTFVGAPGSKAEGLTAYLYRVDFTHAHAETDVNCAENLQIRFGDVARLKYDGETKSDVFVISSGGPGDVGLVSADKVGPVVTLTFATEVCPSGGFTSSQSSFYIGMAAVGEPVTAKVKSDLTFGGGTVKVRARTPQRP